MLFILFYVDFSYIKRKNRFCVSGSQNSSEVTRGETIRPCKMLVKHVTPERVNLWMLCIPFVFSEGQRSY